MDELEISGKRYISAKRAGKENKYHPDYIGQLIRAGKVEGQKVGRAWYVGAISLNTYLSKETHAPEAMVETPEQEEPLIKEELIRPLVKEKEIFIAAKVEAPKEAFVTEKIEELEEIEEHEEPREIHIPIQKKHTGGLSYITDEGPLFPAIRPRQRREEPVISHYSKEDQQTVVSEPLPSMFERPKKLRSAGMLRSVVSLSLIGVVVFGVTLGASYFFSSSNTVVVGKNTASVIFGL